MHDVAYARHLTQQPPSGTIVESVPGTFVWSGTYYEPGKGSMTGTFNLVLNGAQNTYSGTFSTSHDHDLLWDNTVTGTRASATVM